MSDKITYTSSGTVALVYGSCASEDHILFTSATDHTIEHNRKKYAVFLRDPPSDGGPTDAKTLELKDGHVKIKAHDAGRVFKKLGPAASGQVGVDISVHIHKGELRLRRTTVPAKSHTK